MQTGGFSFTTSGLMLTRQIHVWNTALCVYYSGCQLLQLSDCFCMLVALQAAALASDLVSLGLSQAQGGVQLLRLPWLVVEAGQDLTCNRDGEPSLPANK
jgi:hypothetical protein